MEQGERDQRRVAEMRRFLRARYGLRGTLSLHRAALGWDLLRAPLNVALAPAFLVSRLLAWGLSLVGLRSAGAWLARRQFFLTSDVSRQIEADLLAFLARLEAEDLGTGAPPEVARNAVSDLADTRNAVAEITTSLLVFLAGTALFHRATPGVISLAGPLADLRAQTRAIEDFALGSGLGRIWYGAFPAHLAPMEVIVTGIVLALLASLMTSFAGVLADPIQLVTGTHRRRLSRLLARLDHAGARAARGQTAEAAPKLAREHLLARLGDLSDALVSLWRH